jgi:Helix-hairpin-helix motif
MKLDLHYFFIYRSILVCFMMILFSNLKAQNDRESEQKIITEIMERLIENAESTIDYTDIQDQLTFYINHKLNINTATRLDFQKLIFLEESSIDAIINHRLQFGNYLTVYELQSIETIDERTLYLLSYFIKIEDDFTQNKMSFLKMISLGKNVVTGMHENEFEQRAGYDKSITQQGKEYYLGSPYKYVLRYRFNLTNHLSFGLTGKKDMGEQFFQGAQKYGFDFYSFHFELQNQFHFKTIAIGDYQANFGQGLTFGSGLSARKSAYVMNTRRNFENVRAYHSLNENEFLRGTAFLYQFKHFQLTGIFSCKNISTNYREADSLSSLSGDNFSSIELSGLHRTATEILNKDNVLQIIYGGHLKYVGANYDIGFTAVNTFYYHTFIPGNKPYQLYNFSGKQLSNIGVDYNFYLRNINFFGELSYSSNIAFAGISGVSIPLHQTFDVLFLYRNYAKNYQTTFNNPFGENNDGRNEEGFYTAISFKPNSLWALNSYFDIYRSPWLRYMIDAPSHGYDFLSELQFIPTKYSQFYIRYKYEIKNINSPTGNETANFLIDAYRKVIRLNTNYKISSSLAGVSRLEVVEYNNPIIGTKNGTLIFQDFIYTTELKELSLSGRIALFSVEDYNARIYATESDVLNQYSVPLFQNSGVRYYLTVHYRFTKKVDAWIKYSQTTYNNVTTIGTGLQQINGNVLSDLRLQLRWSF